MPRPRRRKFHTTFKARARPLSQEAKNRLSELLANKSEAATFEIAKAVGFYIDGERVINGLPRPADYLLALRSLAKDVDHVRKRIEHLDQIFRTELNKKGTDFAAIERVLTTFSDAIDSTVGDFARLSTQGAPSNNALCELVRRVRLIFRRHYGGPRTESGVRGFARVLSEQERRELKFVETALIDARIVREGEKDLRRLFRDSRCSVPVERDAQIERMVRKARKDRDKRPSS